MKIAVIDDSKVMRAIVKRTLREAGYKAAEVVEAEDGQQGLGLVEGEKPDLVLCDWNMPNMNGIDLLRELRNRGNVVRFGFVTSEGSDEMRETAREAGAAFLVTKPFTADTLREWIEKAIAA